VKHKCRDGATSEAVSRGYVDMTPWIQIHEIRRSSFAFFDIPDGVQILFWLIERCIALLGWRSDVANDMNLPTFANYPTDSHTRHTIQDHTSRPRLASLAR
jgi:hypothetical protein